MAFLIALIILVLHQLRRDIRIVDRLHPSGLLRSPIKRAGIAFVLLIVLPPLFVHQAPWGGQLTGGRGMFIATSAFIAFLISYTWYRYLTWLDPFDREKLRWEMGVFLAACGTTFLTFPLTDLMVGQLGLVLDGSAWNDWWYSVIAIGLVEETVKLLPVLLLLLLTRQVDEPFDLILYGSISALGFAFVENTLYLLNTELRAVGGRVLYASVAHMFFSSIVAYAVAIAQHRGRSRLLYGSVGLLLAAVAHGFYDFWLLSPYRPHLITTLFFLGNIHLWVVMKNNLVNLSPHYLQEKRPMPTMFRYRIINALVAIFGFAYVLKFLLEGPASANDLLAAQGTTMGAMLLFLAISFSSYRFVPGYLAPMLPQKGLWRMLFPVVHWGEDLSGRGLLLRMPEQRGKAPLYMILHRTLPLRGTLAQQIMVEGANELYLFRPEVPVLGASADPLTLLVQPIAENDTIPDDHYAIVAVMALKEPFRVMEGMVQRSALEFVGHVHGKLL